MERILTDEQARVLGSIIEKQITTPQYYPLTPNAIRAACNQKSARDPVVNYSDNQVFDILKSLTTLGYLKYGFLDSSRTAKYEQQFSLVLGLERPETAILCELFLRGPQTPGELRSHCERLYSFGSLAELEECLRGLAQKERVVLLERVPGYKEQRWAHLFCGEPKNVAQLAEPVAVEHESSLAARVSALEEELVRLRERLDRLEGV